MNQNSKNTETIRHRLDLSEEEFSLALGMQRKTYSVHLRESTVSSTVSLAAEALMRRQAQVNDVAFVVRVIKGVLQATQLDDLEPFSFRGQRYLLLPIENGEPVVQTKREVLLDAYGPKPKRERERQPSDTFGFNRAKKAVADALLDAGDDGLLPQQITDIIRPLWPTDRMVPTGVIMNKLSNEDQAVKVGNRWRVKA